VSTPPAPHSRAVELTTIDDPRDRILAAAERCIERHGIRKTTIEDVASEVGMSRPGVYRYFADRDDLLVELISRQARVLRDKAHKFIARQTGLPDQAVEGLLYIADHGRRDPLTRHLIEPDGTSLGRRMTASRTLEILTAEFWDPFLDAAYVNNELPRGLPRSDVILWLHSLGLMLMRGLENGDGDLKRYRSILRRFVAPGFAGSQASVGG
jgi:AcrR family transcriptional regulator